MKRTVLVVDDNPDVREGVAEFLRLHGWEVVTAEHGGEALEVLEEVVHCIGLILLDLAMPVMDGIAFRQRQLQNKAIAHVPVVVVSGEDDVASTASQLEADGYLMKPFDFRKLTEAVEQYLGWQAEPQ